VAKGLIDMKTLYKRLAALLFAFGVSMSCGAASAVASEAALTVTEKGGDGQITAQHHFTMEDLQQMPRVGFDTATIWTSGVQQFAGVSLAHLLTTLELPTDGDGVLSARAINDYSVEIPLADAVEGGPIVAYERNGAVMSLRDKGPLWIVYPFDSDPAYQTEAIYSRSIWQLEEITVTK